MVEATGPLAGMKVIDFSHVMAGPVASLMLADMGADVIKVERMPGGDDTRRMVPPSLDGEAAAFLMMNRNKRSIAVDLKNPDGYAAVRRMLRDADALIENYRADTLERLGLGYEALKQDNPGLIYASISGFGRTGPYADRGGFDLIAQGMSGLMSVTGEAPGGPPMKCGAPLTDITAGILLAMGVAAAYAHKQRTGEGQKLDTSLFEAGIVHTYWQSAIALATGVAPGPMGSAHPLNAPYQAFETADGWITVGAANQRNWERMLDVVGAPRLAEDPRFRTNGDRMANLAALDEVLTGYFRKAGAAHWLAALEKVGVPAGPVLDVAEMHRDPQVLARAMLVDTPPHATLGPVRTIGSPVKFAQTPTGIRRAAPLYGQHSREILAEHGYSEAEIDALVAAGAVAESAAG